MNGNGYTYAIDLGIAPQVDAIMRVMERSDMERVRIAPTVDRDYIAYVDYEDTRPDMGNGVSFGIRQDGTFVLACVYRVSD